MEAPEATREKRRRLPFMRGVLPIGSSGFGPELIAGLTLAALGIPEVMGYTSIAKMPLVTGLYTILVPIAMFAILGSSRHLVVGADSATAAIMAAGLVGLAAPNSTQWVGYAGVTAILVGGLLLLASILRLGFLADFLSRSVLVGFLTGVGIQVAIEQVATMLGVAKGSGNALEQFWTALKEIPDAQLGAVLISVAVIAITLGAKMISPKIPGALIAVVGSIAASEIFNFAAKGISTVGPVPGGLPTFGVPVGFGESASLVATAISIFIVIIAQSAATSRAYAMRYREDDSVNLDLFGLAAASASAGLSGTFVVNGSPTKTEIVDSAGGRSQLAMLVTSGVVLIVLLFLTKPIQYLPSATLASVVFLIGVELIDRKHMRDIAKHQLDEFVIAALTAAIVVLFGVKQGIVIAVALSLLEHVRHSYGPLTGVLVAREGGGVAIRPAEAGTVTEPGLAVFWFGAGLWYANASRFEADVIAVVDAADPPLRWFVLDAAALGDIDYTGAYVLGQLRSQLADRGITVAVSSLADPVKDRFAEYGLVEAIGEERFFPGAREAIAAFRAAPATPPSAAPDAPTV